MLTLRQTPSSFDAGVIGIGERGVKRCTVLSVTKWLFFPPLLVKTVVLCAVPEFNDDTSREITPCQSEPVMF